MERKLIENKQMVKALFIYFGFYIIISNIIVYFLAGNISNVKVMIFIQFLFEMATFIGIYKVCTPLFEDVEYSFEKKMLSDVVKYYFMIIGINFIITMPIMLVAQSDTSKNQEALEILVSNNIVYSLMAILIFAPIIEELIYRGIIYKAVRRKFNVSMSVIMSSGAFGLMHFSLSIISGELDDIIFLPVYIVPSVFLCLIYEKYNNIYAPILLHLVNNGIGIIMMCYSMML